MGSPLLCNRSLACIILNNVKLMKLWVEQRLPCWPFSPSQLPEGGPGLPLILPVWLSSLFIVMPETETLHCPAWLMVKKFGKCIRKRDWTSLGMLLEIGSAPITSRPLLMPCFLYFSLQWGSFDHVLQTWNLRTTLSKRLSRWRQHMQVSSLLYYTKCIHFSIPPVV